MIRSIKKLVWCVPMSPFLVMGFIAALAIIPLKVGYKAGARAIGLVVRWAGK